MRAQRDHAPAEPGALSSRRTREGGAAWAPYDRRRAAQLRRRAPVHFRAVLTMPRAGGNRLALLLSMAMFVLVGDTSIMNVSISSVVHDLDTDVSSVQAAIALEALVSAAFILIGSKVADLIGRKRAYVLGLLGYAVGAVSMALAQSVLV